jgi:chromosome segregation ATPase
MPIFGRKKEEVKLPTAEELGMKTEPFTPVEQLIKEAEKPKEVEQKQEKPAFAPLFVKIDRYRQILNAIGYLKTTMVMIKNSLLTLNELDKARAETVKVLEEALEKTEKKISELDSELVRPAGYHELEEPEYQDMETIEATIADLKGQIEMLKSELQSME